MPEEATGKTGVPSPTRLKPERPRDRLGRPLPWDAEPELHLPDFDEMTLEENHEAGRAFVREGGWFGAHEAWETAWKQARGTGDEEFFKGLSQMGAGYVTSCAATPMGPSRCWNAPFGGSAATRGTTGTSTRRRSRRTCRRRRTR